MPPKPRKDYSQQNLLARIRFMRPINKKLKFIGCIKNFSEKNVETFSITKLFVENFLMICAILSRQQWKYRDDSQKIDYTDILFHFPFVLLWFYFIKWKKNKDPSSRQKKYYEEIGEVIRTSLLSASQLMKENSSEEPLLKDFINLCDFLISLTEPASFEKMITAMKDIINPHFELTLKELCRTLFTPETNGFISRNSSNSDQVKEAQDFIYELLHKNSLVEHQKSIKDLLSPPHDTSKPEKYPLASFFYLLNMMGIYSILDIKLPLNNFLGIENGVWLGYFNEVFKCDLKFFEVSGQVLQLTNSIGYRMLRPFTEAPRRAMIPPCAVFPSSIMRPSSASAAAEGGLPADPSAWDEVIKQVKQYHWAQALGRDSKVPVCRPESPTPQGELPDYRSPSSEDEDDHEEFDPQALSSGAQAATQSPIPAPRIPIPAPRMPIPTPGGPPIPAPRMSIPAPGGPPIPAPRPSNLQRHGAMKGNPNS